MRFTAILVSVFLALTSAAARADAPPPSQALESDPAAPCPRIGLSANGVGIALADFALHLDWMPAGWLATWLEVGESRRHGGDALLLEAGIAIFPLDRGLEGLLFSAGIGVAWAGPWNGADPAARSIGRVGGEAGWQFLWGDLSITLAIGATGFWSPSDNGALFIEPRARAALGIVFR